jgi:hypothetical protein
MLRQREACSAVSISLRTTTKAASGNIEMRIDAEGDRKEGVLPACVE